MTSPSDSPKPIPIRRAASGRTPWARSAQWTVGIAAAVLLAVSVGGYLIHRNQLAAIAAGHLRLQVTGPAEIEAGAEARYAVATTSVTGDPVSAQVEFALLSATGERLIGHKEAVDQSGTLTVVVPAERALPSLVRMTIVAVDEDGNREEVDTILSVRPERRATQLTLDKPVYAPGETVRYRSVTLTRFGLAADREFPVQFEILAPDGAAVPDSRRVGTTDHGVGSGTFQIPEGLADGRYVLVLKSPDGAFPEARRTFSIGRRPAPPPKNEPVGPDAVDVQFFPEGGALAPGLENRVYFAARDARGKAVAIQGAVVAGNGDTVALVESSRDGKGTFSFVPRQDQAYRLVLSTPQGAKTEPRLPEVSVDQKIAVSAGNGIFEAASPLEFNVRASEPGLPLVVAAYCRGVQVGEQTLVTQVGEEDHGSNLVVIDLPEGVRGVIRLVVYDYSQSPPRPIAERLVYRRMERKLNVAVDVGDEPGSPGETVEVQLTVTDEAAQPVTAALGVAAIHQSALNQSGGGPPSLPTQFLLLDEIEHPTELGDADSYLSDGADAAVALDLLLGTRGRRRSADPAPAMFDNLDQLVAQYRENFEDYRTHRTRLLDTATTVSFFAGLGLVLFVAMLGLLKIVEGIRLWVPAVGVTITSLILGAILMDPGRLGGGPSGDVPFSPFNMAHQDAAKSPADGVPDAAEAPVTDSSAQAESAPETADKADFAETPFWAPLLIAKDGKATVKFKLPESAATIRLRVDAHDSGRIGAGRGEIVSRSSAQAKP